MTKAQIITKCELYLDDTSELSSQEMSELFDKVYRDICSDRPWEFTKSTHTATASGTTVSLPSDFLYLVKNYDWTDPNTEGGRPVVFVGSDYTPYQVVNWSDRRRYRTHSDKAYLDIPNDNLVFTSAVSDSIEFDYHAQQTALSTSESPVFPEEFHQAIVHGMAVDDFMIQHYPKAESYANENRAKYKDYLERMAYWNSKLIQLD